MTNSNNLIFGFAQKNKWICAWQRFLEAMQLCLQGKLEFTIYIYTAPNESLYKMNLYKEMKNPLIYMLVFCALSVHICL